VRLAVAFWATSLVIALSLAHAEAVELTYDPRIDLPLTLVATSWVIGSEAAKSHLAPAECRWCNRTADGRDTLNSVDASIRAALRWKHTELGNLLSNVVGYAVAPLATFGLLALAQWHDDALQHFPTDALIVLEAVSLALAASQVVKFSTGRQRPFVHARQADGAELTSHSSDDNTSFYSGHTAFTFALAVAAGTVATMRGYRWARWVWTTGLFLATVTAYSRVASDRHYFSDVMLGSVTGAVIGVSIPLFLHRACVPTKQPVPVVSGIPGGALVSLVWTPP
jgi:membrane-associated phospholipid phosphatase